VSGGGTLFSFTFFAVAAFFCAGAYYLVTGVTGALLAMLGIGISAAALFRRAWQQHLSVRTETEGGRDAQTREILREVCSLVQQCREEQERGTRHIADEVRALHEGIDLVAAYRRESLAAHEEAAVGQRSLLAEIRQGISQPLGILAENQRAVIEKIGTLAAVRQGCTEKLAENQCVVIEKIGMLTATQQGCAEKLAELAELGVEMLTACDRDTALAEKGNEHLSNMERGQMKRGELTVKLDDLDGQLRGIRHSADHLEGMLDEIQQPIMELGENLSGSLQAVMQELKAQHKAQQSAMEQYKSMTAKDVQILEQLARAVK